MIQLKKGFNPNVIFLEYLNLKLISEKLELIDSVLRHKASPNYRKDPKFWDRLASMAWANSADPDKTAPRGEV